MYKTPLGEGCPEAEPVLWTWRKTSGIDYNFKINRIAIKEARGRNNEKIPKVIQLSDQLIPDRILRWSE
jgi:hypothetical protein